MGNRDGQRKEQQKTEGRDWKTKGEMGMGKECSQAEDVHGVKRKK